MKKSARRNDHHTNQTFRYGQSGVTPASNFILRNFASKVNEYSCVVNCHTSYGNLLVLTCPELSGKTHGT